jgi:hypothetical protein
MANKEQLQILKTGVTAWNEWLCRQAVDIVIDLGGADLRAVNLRGANLRGANLADADLSEADLSGASLQKASLVRAYLRGALATAAPRLSRTQLLRLIRDREMGGLPGVGRSLVANFSEADLSGANLSGVYFNDANLSEANLTKATFSETVISNVDLSTCKNLGTIRHNSPSRIDISTLQRSGPLPLEFLRGVGLPDKLIDNLSALLDQAVQFFRQWMGGG